MKNELQFSKFGEKFTKNSAILQLMDDLGNALQNGAEVKMLGGGNPANISAVNEVFMATMNKILNTESAKFIENISNYCNPQGDAQLIDALVTFFNENYNLNINAANIALTNGSQNTFFYLFNLFSGTYNNEQQKDILLPLLPEYVGYGDIQLEGAHFTTILPKIMATTHEGKGGFFKYQIDFEKLNNHPALENGKIGAICCSRPTNPSGNVISDDEIKKLMQLAKKYNIPLIIDNAYGIPFPNIVFDNANLYWDDNTILCFSLSKLGLPSVRSAIVIANEKVIAAISSLNAIVNLAPTRFGSMLITPLLQNNNLISLCANHIRPFYKKQIDFTVNLIHEIFADIPVVIHKPQGAIFLWLWFKNLPVDTNILYRRLKEKGTIIIPGSYFFPTLDLNNYQHGTQCIRLSIAQTQDTIRNGLIDIREEILKLYNDI